VIGVDLRGQEVEADLATPAGRSTAIAAVRDACRGALDGLVCCAGLGPQFKPAESIVSVNYFGAVALFDGLREILAGGSDPAAVAVSSNSASISPGADGPIAAACLEGDEAAATAAASGNGVAAYSSSKLALARWVRRNAVAAPWAGAGIRLNAVAPGATLTPLLQGGLDDEKLGPAIRGLPIPLGGVGSPEQIASAIVFLLGPESTFCCGTILFADGGSDALIRPNAI